MYLVQTLRGPSIGVEPAIKDGIRREQGRAILAGRAGDRLTTAELIRTPGTDPNDDDGRSAGFESAPCLPQANKKTYPSDRTHRIFAGRVNDLWAGFELGTRRGLFGPVRTSLPIVGKLIEDM